MTRGGDRASPRASPRSSPRSSQASLREFNWAPFVRAAETSKLVERVLGTAHSPTASARRRPGTSADVDMDSESSWREGGGVWSEAVREGRKQAANRRLWY